MAIVYRAPIENIAPPMEEPQGLSPASSESLDAFDFVRMHPAVLTLEQTADKIGILEPALNTRAGKYITGLVSRLHKVSDAMAEDTATSIHPTTDRWVRRSMYATQVTDRARLAMILASNAAIDAFTWSKDGRWAGVAAGTVFAGWSLIVGETLNQTLDRTPRAVKAVQEEFPVAVDLMADALPKSRKERSQLEPKTDSLVPPDSSEVDSSGQIDEATFVSKAIRLATLPVRLPLTTLRRGISSVSWGSTAFVGTERFQGGDKNDGRKQYAKVMGYGGLFCAGVAWAAVERIDQLTADGKYEQAQDLYNLIDNDMTWLKLGIVSIVVELGSAKLRKMKLVKQGRISSSNEAIETT